MKPVLKGNEDERCCIATLDNEILRIYDLLWLTLKLLIVLNALTSCIIEGKDKWGLGHKHQHVICKEDEFSLNRTGIIIPLKVALLRRATAQCSIVRTQRRRDKRHISILWI